MQKVEAFLRKKGTGVKKLIGRGNIKRIDKGVIKGTSVLAIQIPLKFRFESEGDYEVTGRIAGYKSTSRIPLVVQTMPWPTFTQREIHYLRSNPSRLPQIRATVECEKCKSPYVFQEFPIEAPELPKNVYRFPESGEFKCEKCSTSIPLKDVQGQIRDSLKKQISDLLRRKT